MTLLEALMLLSGEGAPPLVETLDMLAAARPDLQPTVDDWKTRLSSEVGGDGLASVVAALPEEAKNIIRLKLDPRDSPGLLA